MHFLGTIVVVEIPYFSLSLSLSLSEEESKILRFSLNRIPLSITRISFVSSFLFHELEIEIGWKNWLAGKND